MPTSEPQSAMTLISDRMGDGGSSDGEIWIGWGMPGPGMGDGDHGVGAITHLT